MWPRWPKGTDHCSSEEYRCTHLDTCLARTWISYRCVPCHPWCTHRTFLVVKKITFPVAVNNSITVGPLVLFVISVCNHGEHYETPCMSVSLSQSVSSLHISSRNYKTRVNGRGVCVHHTNCRMFHFDVGLNQISSMFCNLVCLY